MKNVFLFTGEDDFRLEEELRRWRKAFLGKHGELNLNVVDFESCEKGEVVKAVMSLPFLGEKRLVVVRGLPLKGGGKTKEELVEKEEEVQKMIEGEGVPDSTILVLVSPKPDKRRKFTKVLKGVAEEKIFEVLKDWEMVDWVRGRVKKKGLRINSDAVGLLLEKTGGNMWVLSQEIEKLALGIDEGGEIGVEEVGQMVSGERSEDIFALMDNLGGKDERVVIEKFRALVAVGESVSQIFYMLVRQVRLIAQVKALIEAGEEGQMVKKMGVHPFVVKRVKGQSGKFSLSDVKWMYSEILKIDRQLKTSGIEMTVGDTREFELVLEDWLLRVTRRIKN